MVIVAGLALLSLALGLWQWGVAARFPLHCRTPVLSPAPGVTVFKPLKGCDSQTERCLESWFQQDYPGPVQLLFGVASNEDPVCAVVRRLIEFHPQREARLVICPESFGPNPKVSTLIALELLAAHDMFVVSDADVWAPQDLLANLVAPLARNSSMACSFYRLTGPANLAMKWEVVATNADFWSSVLQARSLKPLHFALGAAMALPRRELRAIGGFRALAADLADDYQLGHRIAARGGRIDLCPVVVECRSSPLRWTEVWAHQLRWARTIRVCQPGPYFLSILSNGTWWPLLWLLVQPGALSLGAALACLTVRLASAWYCERKLCGPGQASTWWIAPAKDLLQVLIWAMAFASSEVVWRGNRFQVTSGGKLVPAAVNAQNCFSRAERETVPKVAGELPELEQT